MRDKLNGFRLIIGIARNVAEATRYEPHQHKPKIAS